jgi:hypothetical protein
MLVRVGQRLGHDVVSADFDRVRQASVDRDVEADGGGTAAGQCLERWTKSALGQDRGMYSARDLLDGWGDSWGVKPCPHEVRTPPPSASETARSERNQRHHDGPQEDHCYKHCGECQVEGDGP